MPQQGNHMNEELLWPPAPRDPVADAKQLLKFIDTEILTLEFVQGIDGDVEPELRKSIAEYRKTKKQILEAIERTKGV